MFLNIKIEGKRFCSEW